jgi:ABC-type Fe3+ transport system permease subunit
VAQAEDRGKAVTSKLLGVSPVRTLLVLVVPLMAGAIISGMILTFFTVASELSSSVVLYSGPWRTLTIVMFQSLEGTGAGVAVAAAATGGGEACGNSVSRGWLREP